MVGFSNTPSGQGCGVASPQAPQPKGSSVMKGVTAVALTTVPVRVTSRPAPSRRAFRLDHLTIELRRIAVRSTTCGEPVPVDWACARWNLLVPYIRMQCNQPICAGQRRFLP